MPPNQRIAFRLGNFSVVTPRPCSRIKTPNGIILYQAVSPDASYDIASQRIPDRDYESMQAMGLANWIRKMEQASLNLPDKKITNHQSGMFGKFPCLRFQFDFPNGAKGVQMVLFHDHYSYILGYAQRGDNEDWSEAQRYFASFKLEKLVKKDPELAKDPGY